MATLEDKILGEKLHNYCSSSEGEDEKSEDEGDSDSGAQKVAEPELKPPPVNKWKGTANNTGPKGVIEDWRRYKQLEAEHREDQEREKLELIKKLSLATRTDREEEIANQKQELEDELEELENDDFISEYQKRRMQELLEQLKRTPQFGKVLTLKSKDDFLHAIDKEDPTVIVIVHIYDYKNSACDAMDGCLNILASEYPVIKFCRIAADVSGLSRNFKLEGVPALLVYKAGQTVGNFVKLASELGEDFYATDVQRFLLEYGLLPDKNIVIS